MLKQVTKRESEDPLSSDCVVPQPPGTEPASDEFLHGLHLVHWLNFEPR